MLAQMRERSEALAAVSADHSEAGSGKSTCSWDRSQHTFPLRHTARIPHNIARECLNHVIVFEGSMRSGDNLTALLQSYAIEYLRLRAN